MEQCLTRFPHTPQHGQEQSGLFNVTLGIPLYLLAATGILISEGEARPRTPRSIPSGIPWWTWSSMFKNRCGEETSTAVYIESLNSLFVFSQYLINSPNSRRIGVYCISPRIVFRQVVRSRHSAHLLVCADLRNSQLTRFDACAWLIFIFTRHFNRLIFCDCMSCFVYYHPACRIFLNAITLDTFLTLQNRRFISTLCRIRTIGTLLAP